MDIKQLRDMMREWYHSSLDPRDMTADEDFFEAARAIRALKSLFEQELRDRAAAAEMAQQKAADQNERTG